MWNRNALGRKALVIAVALGAEWFVTPATAQDSEDVRQRIEALQEQVSALARQQHAFEQQHANDGKNVVTSGATKGSFRLPGSDTSVTLGGYVKLDAVFSNPSAGVGSTADLFLQPGAIPVGPGAGDNEHNQVKFGARESRLFAKTSTPTSLGELITYVEGDFYGADGNESVSNSHGPRLRHAYGSLGHLLAGQTWTNFMFVPSLPETLDFGGPAGQIFDRQAQVRWTQSFNAMGPSTGGQWSVALENPESIVTIPGGTTFRADDDHVPDISGQAVFNTTRGKIAVSALLRQIRADSRTPAVVDEAWGAAISVAGAITTVGKDDVRFTASAGNGIGRYSNGVFTDAIVATDGSVQLPRQWIWYGAYRHYWSDALRSNVVLSAGRASNPAGTAASANKSVGSLHANLILSAVANTDLGIEYIHATRKTEDGQSGHLNRLQFSAKYAF